jgi:hypothetical protein
MREGTLHMTTPTTSTTSTAAGTVAQHPLTEGMPIIVCGRSCWPTEDDWHRAHTRIELPPERYLRAFWHAEILDITSRNPHDHIIERSDPFVVRFRVELEGRLWRCISGHWCFNVGFTAIGSGPDFNLSEEVKDPGEFQIPDWTGCEELCVGKCVTVPGNTIPAGAAPANCCGTVYEVAAWFELRCCGGCGDPKSHLACSGFERLGEYQFV